MVLLRFLQLPLLQPIRSRAPEFLDVIMKVIIDHIDIEVVHLNRLVVDLLDELLIKSVGIRKNTERIMEESAVRDGEVGFYSSKVPPGVCTKRRMCSLLFSNFYMSFAELDPLDDFV